MNKPILGKNVLIQFDRGFDFGSYFCATDVEISFQMQTKETKTIGDGGWKRKRGQSKSASISLSGIAALSSVAPTSFTLLDYFDNMVDIPFRIIFSDEQFDTKVIEGMVLPTDITLSGGSEGHANGSMTLEVNGPVDIRDAVVPCSAAVTSVTYLGEVAIFGNFRINSISSGPISRFDYSVDGGGVNSIFASGAPPVNFNAAVSGANGTDHTIEIWPVCENGYLGTSYVLNFTKSN